MFTSSSFSDTESQSNLHEASLPVANRASRIPSLVAANHRLSWPAIQPLDYGRYNV